MPTDTETEVAVEATRRRLLNMGDRGSRVQHWVVTRPHHLPPATVQELAHAIWVDRESRGIPGSPEQDWEEALAMHALQVGRSPERLVSEEMRSAAEKTKMRTDDAARKKQEEKEIKDFFKYRMTVWFPHGSTSLKGVSRVAGCGPSTISYLTGEHPLILKRHFGEEGISEDKMATHLRSFGFEITRVSDRMLKHNDGVMTTPLTPYHVVLVSMRATANKNTWAIMFGDTIIHNWERIPLNRMTFANHPIISMFVLWHPSWLNIFDLVTLLMKSDPTKSERNFELMNETDRDTVLRDLQLVDSVLGRAINAAYTDVADAQEVEALD